MFGYYKLCSTKCTETASTIPDRWFLYRIPLFAELQVFQVFKLCDKYSIYSPVPKVNAAASEDEIKVLSHPSLDTPLNSHYSSENLSDIVVHQTS